MQLLNPKVALFFLAFLPQFVDPERGPAATQVLVLGAILGALGLAMDCGYALLASASAAKRFSGTATAGHRRRLHRARRRRRTDGRSSLILEGDNLPHLRELPDETRADGLRRPAVQHRPHPDPPQPRHDGRAGGRSDRLRRAPLHDQAARGVVLSSDDFDDYLGFLAPRLEEIRRVLHPTGTLYLHLDYREAHYVKLLLDELFGRECFLNELIWAYDYGAKPKGRWPQKHDTILVYVKDPRAYYFDSDAVDREPYMAPGLVTPEKVGEGQAAGERDVAHDRLPHRPREDRLPDAEAGGPAAALRAGVLARGRPVPGPVRRLRARSAPSRASSAAATC